MSSPTQDSKRVKFNEKKEFYKNHGAAILRQVLSTRSPSTIKSNPSCTPKQRKKYREFYRNTFAGKAAYRKIMIGDGSSAEKRAAYNQFYNSGVNVQYLKDNPRKISSEKPLYPISSMLKYLKQKNAELKKGISPYLQPWEVQVRPSVDYTLGEAIVCIQETWDVELTPEWSIVGWWYGYHRLKITDYYGPGPLPRWFTKHRYGTMWVAKGFKPTDNPSGIAIPVGVSDTVVIAPYTEKLIHEMTHAVQNAYIPYWEMPRENVEVATMLIERKYGPGFSKEYISQTLSLAIADLESTDAVDFDKILARESPVNNPGCISSRFTPYYMYPRSYYTYALGMILPIKTITTIRGLVRDSEKVLMYVNDNLGIGVPS
jgi:hypothetical protein